MAEIGQRIINLQSGKSAYFASDQHFGAPTIEKSKVREQKFINWLNHIKKDAQVLFLLGDLFDFWYEYKTVVPKGFVRILGKLAELQDSGIKIYFWTGNHDLWIMDYFQKELNIEVFFDKQEFIIDNKQFLIAHGDGLGPDDKGYKRMKKLFTHPLSQSLFRWLHPDIGMALGNYFSKKNKLISGVEDTKFLGEEKEWLVIYSQKKIMEKPYNYLIFGHRHLPLEIKLNDISTYINLGDWVEYFTYGKYTAQNFELLKWE